MTTNTETTTSSPAPGRPAGASPRPETGDELTRLRQRLVAQAEAQATDENLVKLIRLAGAEAEALAWQTPFPLLLLPALIEEKIVAVRRYAARQTRVRQGYRRVRAEPR